VPAKVKRHHKLLFLITAVVAMIFAWFYFGAASSGIDFKNLELKRNVLIILIVLTLTTFISTAIALWQLIDDTLQTKIMITGMLIAFSVWASIRYFDVVFDFYSNQWQTKTVSRYTSGGKTFYRLEQQKTDYFFFHKPYKKRTIVASDILGIFWKIEKTDSEEDIPILNIKF
jgi:hypothetical protein